MTPGSRDQVHELAVPKVLRIPASNPPRESQASSGMSAVTGPAERDLLDLELHMPWRNSTQCVTMLTDAFTRLTSVPGPRRRCDVPGNEQQADQQRTTTDMANLLAHAREMRDSNSRGGNVGPVTDLMEEEAPGPGPKSVAGSPQASQSLLRMTAVTVPVE